MVVAASLTLHLVFSKLPAFVRVALGRAKAASYMTMRDQRQRGRWERGPISCSVLMVLMVLRFETLLYQGSASRAFGLLQIGLALGARNVFANVSCAGHRVGSAEAGCMRRAALRPSAVEREHRLGLPSRGCLTLALFLSSFQIFTELTP
jgi:hypothetical protein